MDYWKIRGCLLAWQKICLIFTLVTQIFTSWKHILWPSNIKHHFPDLLWFTEQLESWCSLIWWTILLTNSFYSLKQRKKCKGKKILCTNSNFSVQQENTNISDPAHWTPVFCRGYSWTADLKVHPFFLCLVPQFIFINQIPYHMTLYGGKKP